MKHTPGPWRAGRPDMATIVDGWDSKWIYADDHADPDNIEKTKHIAVASSRDVEDWSEVMANARLIAAAPELLEALEKFVVHMPSKPHCTIGHLQAYDLAVRAIAKAKGENHE